MNQASFSISIRCGQPHAGQVQSQRPRLYEVEIAHIAGRAASAAVESHFQRPTPSKWALQSEVVRSALHVESRAAEVDRIRQDYNCKVQSVLFEHNCQ